MRKKTELAELPTFLVLIPQRTNGEPYTTSKIIAELAGVKHHVVQKILSKYQQDFETCTFFPSSRPPPVRSPSCFVSFAIL